ncbi:MAG: 3-hydroxyacyl-CoA dehydrogenase NAD-binding domain-containing protein [Candidatus Cyclobacteriaceae bacterium M2_1C_046]
MRLEDIHTIGIIGAGTMGQGIAQVAALAGYEVILYDLKEDILDRSLSIISGNIDKGVEKGKIQAEEAEKAKGRISATSDFISIEGEIIIEAALEQLKVKHDVFLRLEEQLPASTILATNTSSIPITQIAARLKHPERVVGMHFFNPAHIMKLVEVIEGAATDPEIAATTKALAEKMGKTAVMAKDSPGFIVNRVARHFYVESLKILEEGVADHETIDGIMENNGFRMGPYRLMDLIGVDTNFSVTTSMFESFHYDGKFRPSRIQQQKVDAGHHGRKTGRGFYRY